MHVHSGISGSNFRSPAKGLCAPCLRRGCLRVAKRHAFVPPVASAVAEAEPSVEDKQEAIRKKMQWFRIPPKVYFKGGCLEVAMAELAGKKRAMIITDQKVYDLELTAKVVDCLDANNIQNQVFTHVPSAPTESTIRDGLREINDMRPDVIIAIGGGSPMDAAKVMWLLYEVPSLNLKKLIADSGMGRSRMEGAHASMGSKALCICIPTTSGTGAEVTPFAVIKDETTGRNVTLANYALTPSMAIVDPQLVMNLPAKQTAYGGQLTLAHAMESYISIFSSEYTHAEAKHAMSMMSRYYERAYRKGNMDYHAREKMHNAATVAGMSFANTYLGVCHALATEIAITTGCHVGLASGVLLPYVLAFMATNNKATKGALADLSDHLHVGGTTQEERYTNVMDWVKSMQAAADIPTTLTAALDAQACAALTYKLDAVCEAALANAHVVAAPVTPTLDDLKAILKAAGI